MTVTGFVLINTKNGNVRNVCKNLQNNKEIIETYMMHGDYNILVKIRIDISQSINELVNRLQKVPDVSKVNPLIGMRYIKHVNMQDRIDTLLEF